MSHPLKIQKLKNDLETFEKWFNHLSPLSSQEVTYLTSSDSQLTGSYTCVHFDSNEFNDHISRILKDLSVFGCQSLLKELHIQTWLKLSSQSIEISYHTRLALWERLWITLTWQHGSTDVQTLRLNSDDKKNCCYFAQSISTICATFTSDPQWSVSLIRDQKKSFFAEESICYVINRLYPELNLSVAPLAADILHGLDLSVKRKHPRSKAWFQLSLSGEKLLHLKKVKKLQFSAAIAILSPWTLAQLYIEKSKSSKEKISRILHHGSAIEHTYDMEKIARVFSLEMKLLFATTKPQLIQNLKSPAMIAFSALIYEFLCSHLGKKARHRYQIKPLNLTVPAHILAKMT